MWTRGRVNSQTACPWSPPWVQRHEFISKMRINKDKHVNLDESLGIFKGIQREMSENLMSCIRLREWQKIERSKMIKMKDRMKKTIGLPCWLSGKELTCQCRRHRFDPWAGEIPHVFEQLTPCTPTTEPVRKSLGVQLLSPCAATSKGCAPRAHHLQQETPPQWEDLAPQLELSPH